MVERMLRDVAAAHGLASVVLRYFNAAGADPAGEIGERHRPETHLLPLAMAAVCGEQPELDIFGTDYPTSDGTCIRDYVHVSDLAEAHVLALDYLCRGGVSTALNLGIGRGHSVREVLAAVAAVAGRPVPFRDVARRPGDPPMLVAEAKRARDVLGWTPRLTRLDEIVESAWRWHQRQATGVDGPV
jgi:UDP-glucose-4-epimerase GalE